LLVNDSSATNQAQKQELISPHIQPFAGSQQQPSQPYQPPMQQPPVQQQPQQSQRLAQSYQPPPAQQESILLPRVRIQAT
jgi:hypothetical protein